MTLNDSNRWRTASRSASAAALAETSAFEVSESDAAESDAAELQDRYGLKPEQIGAKVAAKPQAAPVTASSPEAPQAPQAKPQKPAKSASRPQAPQKPAKSRRPLLASPPIGQPARRPGLLAWLFGCVLTIESHDPARGDYRGWSYSCSLFVVQVGYWRLSKALFGYSVQIVVDN